MRKDSLAYTDKDRRGERCGVMVVIFVVTCASIIVTIGVVALFYQGKDWAEKNVIGL